MALERFFSFIYLPHLPSHYLIVLQLFIFGHNVSFSYFIGKYPTKRVLLGLNLLRFVKYLPKHQAELACLQPILPLSGSSRRPDS
jgi:hypothetical protein